MRTTLLVLFSYLISCVFNIEAALACGNGRAVISGAIAYPPLSWRDANNKLVGASVELAQRIFSEVGITAISDEGAPWKRVIQRAKLGQIDLVLGVRKTPAYETALTYIEPPITPSSQSVFISAQRPFLYHSWSDLKNKAGSMTLGTSFTDEFDKFSKHELHIQYVNKVEQNFTKLEKSRVDYILGPRLPLQLYIKKHGFEGKIVPADTYLMVINEYFAFAKDSPCRHYQAHFENRLKEYVKDENMEPLLEKYFARWADTERSPVK